MFKEPNRVYCLNRGQSVLCQRYKRNSGKEFGFKRKYYGKLWESLKQRVMWSGIHSDTILTALRKMDCRGARVMAERLVRRLLH